MAEAQLPGVGVTGKGERYVGLPQHSSSPMGGVVAEEYLEHALRQALHGFAQVAVVGKWRSADVFHPDDCNGIAATANEGVFVEE